MGVLPGWWLGEADDRFSEPYIPVTRWDKELRAAGFDGVNAASHDGYLNENIIALPTRPLRSSTRLTILCGDKEDKRVAEIDKCFCDMGYVIDYCSITEIPPPQQDILSLLDLERPFLHDANEVDFDAFVSFMRSIKGSGLLWITGASQIACRNPKYALVLGLARVCRTEMSMDFGTLELENFEQTALGTVLAVFQEFEARLHEPQSHPTLEWAYSNGDVQISRYHYIEISEELKVKRDQTAARKLEMHRTGLANMYWKQTEAHPLEDYEVEIAVRAVGLNFKVNPLLS
jgi:hypothetical protein